MSTFKTNLKEVKFYMELDISTADEILMKKKKYIYKGKKADAKI
jgi:hypothetical protein